MATETELFHEAWEASKAEALSSGYALSIGAFRAGWNALADLLGREHYVTYTEDGWSTEHSLACRLSGNMAHCAYHGAAGEASDPGVLLGRYRITDIAENGHAMLERADA
jgi:hypothetical protein